MQRRTLRHASISLALAGVLACALTGCAGSKTAPSDSPQTEVATSKALETITEPATQDDSHEPKQNEAAAQSENATDTTEAADKNATGAAEEGERTAGGATLYTDGEGKRAYIPAKFRVSPNADEQTISTGLVVIGPDDSEYVWIPTDSVGLTRQDFGSYYSAGSSAASFHDETELDSYQAMASSVEEYGGFYLSRYEASEGDDGLPASKRTGASGSDDVLVHFSPQDATDACARLYSDNGSVQGFFPWGVNWDTTLAWFVDSGRVSWEDIAVDSVSWGNYGDDSFSKGAGSRDTGTFEEAQINNIYDLAGNNWEWTQERLGSNYVMRGGGCTLMGRECSGSAAPAAIRDPLPGNNHHPNVTFRIGLYVK